MPLVETLNSSVDGMSILVRGNSSNRCWIRPAAALLASLVLASVADHLLASWLEFSPPPRGSIGLYRRVGTQAGPQVFVAGSSLTVAALHWSEVSQALGQGIETWSVAGSSPDIWEVWQQHSPHSTTAIIGVSVYDLNEMHVAPDRANVVALSQTIKDLWSSHASASLWRRLVTQYALGDVRLFFPTAGASESVLVAVRAKVSDRLGRKARLDQYEGVVVDPSPPALAAGESTASINDWSSGRLLRRVEALREEDRNRQEFFRGPKYLAFLRLLLRTRKRGRVIIVVLPISSEYREQFLDESSTAAFEREINEAMAVAPEATLVRLDRLPGISDAKNFLDLAHLNSLGRRMATEAFLKQATQRK